MPLDISFFQQLLYLSIVFLLGQLLDMVKPFYEFIFKVFQTIIQNRVEFARDKRLVSNRPSMKEGERKAKVTFAHTDNNVVRAFLVIVHGNFILRY